MTDDRVAVETVLPNMGLHPLEEGWTPLEAFVLIKALQEDGQQTWSYRTTAPLNRHELLGALVVHTELLRQELVSEWADDDEDN